MTTLDPEDGHVVLINTFTVDPDRADELLDVLSRATADGMRHRPGFVSANLHVSTDRRHVANYAQWRSQADIDAMMRDDAAREHMNGAAAIATSFEPISYLLRECQSAADVAVKTWVGVASREHVRLAVRGGFCQVNHGKEAPLKRLARGDRLLYYSPREDMRAGKPVQAFTAIGEIVDDAPYRASAGSDFHPFRRNVRYCQAHDAPIRPLLEQLSFTRGRASWGQAFRRGLFRIEDEDCRAIAAAMRARDAD